MNGKVLVTYATKHGATAEIAERIGEVLAQSGLDVDVLPVDRVSDVGLYSAVVFGGAVYAGTWRKEAVEFLEENEAALAGRPVWIFSSGPTGAGDPVELLEGWRLPEAQRATVERIWPQDVAVFHGAIEPKKLSAGERFLVRAIGAPMADSRDWKMIDDWAKQIVRALALRGDETGGRPVLQLGR